jgi:Tol biopolymer transport system component
MVAARGEIASPNLWLYDLARKSESEPISTGFAVGGAAVWAEDGSRVLFEIKGPEGPGLYQKDLDSGRLELVQETDSAKPLRRFSDWSNDGKYLVYTEVDPNTHADIWYVPVESGRPTDEAVKLLGTAASESQGQLSPDGKWLAYYSDQTGGNQVYVRSFPAGSEEWGVSEDNGREPRWRSDGRELYFLADSGPDRFALMAAAVEPDGLGGLRIGSPQRLFEVGSSGVMPSANLWRYSPDLNGERFLVRASTEDGEVTVNVMTNWHDAAEMAGGR